MADDREAAAVTLGEPTIDILTKRAAAPTPASPGAEPRRPRGRPFAPGNPGGGRRKQSAAWKADMKKGAAYAPKVLLHLMADRQTPRETRRKCAEFFITWMHGKPIAAVSNPDGSPLFAPGAPADNPVSQLLRRLAARRSDAGAADPQGPTPAENAPPGADGEAPGGRAA